MITPLQEIINMLSENEELEYVIEHASNLLSAEQDEIELAWLDGNEKGWRMETDWPQDATKYYKEKFSNSDISKNIDIDLQIEFLQKRIERLKKLKEK